MENRNNFNNNNFNNPNNNPNGKKKGFGEFLKKYSFIILLLVAVAFMLIFNNSNIKTEEIDINTLVQKIEAGEVNTVYIQNGSEKAKVLLNSASEEDKKKFPDKYEFWVVINNINAQMIYDAVDKTINEGYEYEVDGNGNFVFDANGEKVIKKDENGNPIFKNAIADCKIQNATTPVDISSFIMPALYITILLVSLFMIYRFISRAGGGKAGSFGKGKIKNGQMSKIKFQDVAGINEEKEELEEIVDFLKDPKKYTDIGARIPKGVLLVGDPGTGKTLLAKAIAGESGVPFFSMSGSDFVEMFVGVGASRVRDLFEEAKKNAPCIIFIDEIDAVGRRRGTGGNGGNDEREQTLNQLLVEMDGFEGKEGIIIIAATNRADILDPALTRPGRFDRKVVIYPPDIKGREDILRIHAKNKRLSSDVDFKTLSRITSGFTGANLESLMNEAALRAAKFGKYEISMVDITESVNKVLLGVQKKSRVLTEKDREITAYHEAGHAILGLLLENCSEVQEVSIIPRGFAGGYTLSREEDKVHTTYNRLNDEIAMTMGGRVAEKIKFEDITTGASNDIVQATKLARKMVTEWGMSKLGFVNYSNDEDMFLGGGFTRNNSISEKTAQDIDEEINKILHYNFERAEAILLENKDIMDEMAKVLLDRETIYKEDMEKLLQGVKAEELIKEIAERETAKHKRDLEEGIKVEALRLLEDVIKGKNSLNVMKSGNFVNEEQYNKLYDGLKSEYNEKRDSILKRIKENELDLDFSNDLIEYDSIKDIEYFHKRVAGDAFKKIANDIAKKENKDIPYPELENGNQGEISAKNSEKDAEVMENASEVGKENPTYNAENKADGSNEDGEDIYNALEMLDEVEMKKAFKEANEVIKHESKTKVIEDDDDTDKKC